jgi:hypothetical protein
MNLRHLDINRAYQHEPAGPCIFTPALQFPYQAPMDGLRKYEPVSLPGAEFTALQSFAIVRITGSVVTLECVAEA